MPTAVLKEAMAKRAKIKPTVRVNVRSIVERPKSAEIITRNFRVQEVTTYSTVKNNVKGGMKNQAVKRQPASNSRPKEDDAGILAVRQIPSSFQGAGVLRPDPKFVPRTEYGLRSR
jgi:hypothetical protein